MGDLNDEFGTGPANNICGNGVPGISDNNWILKDLYNEIGITNTYSIKKRIYCT